MKIKDLMTVDVAAVPRTATLKQVAAVMADRGISGLPVVTSEGDVVGVVSEADVILKVASRPESAGILGRIFPLANVDARRLEALTAGEAMTSPAITIEADRSVAEAARRMVEKGIKRLPVVRAGKLVGIVSRSDLVRAFVRSDAEIWEELRGEMMKSKLWASPEEIDVSVNGGRVTVTGRVATRTLVDLAEAIAWRVPGVASVDCAGLAWKTDDRATLGTR